MLTGIIAIVAIGATIAKVFNGPVGQALARRISGKSGGPDPDLMTEVLELRHHVEQLGHRLGDAEERLDFSERLLAQRSESADRRS